MDDAFEVFRFGNSHDDRMIKRLADAPEEALLEEDFDLM